jgi:small multidrug resistance pump
MTKLLLLNSAFLSCLLAGSHAILKWVSIQGNDSSLENALKYWYLVGSALCIYGFIFFYYLYILRTLPLSMLYPVYTGLSVIMVMIVGHFYFKESLNISQIGGTFLIFMGIFLISWTKTEI